MALLTLSPARERLTDRPLDCFDPGWHTREALLDKARPPSRQPGLWSCLLRRPRIAAVPKATRHYCTLEYRFFLRSSLVDPTRGRASCLRNPWCSGWPESRLAAD